VADAKNKLEAIGLTRRKAALIGALAVVLAGLVYRQLGGSKPDEMATTVSDSKQAPPASQAPAAGSSTSVAAVPVDDALDEALVEFDQSKWQVPELEKVIAFDPFALPKSFPQPPRAVVDPALAAEGGDASAAALQAEQLASAVDQMQSQLQELQQRGVHVIVNLNDEYVAMIGDRTVHVGDEINGFVVTAIEPDGVRIERKAVQ
jgi:hypothetical protein